MIDQQYEGNFNRNEYICGAYEASKFVETLGDEGLWVSFTGAPLMDESDQVIGAVEVIEDFKEKKAAAQHFDLMKKIARAEWDTLLFFYGVILCVGGLAQFGYLGVVSQYMYHDLGATWANVIVGVLSAIVDNIPVMFAVLTMDPDHVPRPMAAGDPDGRGRRKHAFHRFRRRCGLDGNGPGNLHFRRPPEMDPGHHSGVCGQYSVSPAHQCEIDVKADIR